MTRVLTILFTALALALPAAASAETLDLDRANCALHGGCPATQDDDIYVKKLQLERAGWNIDHSWLNAHGHIDGDPENVLTVQRYLTVKGYLLDRVFFSRIYPSHPGLLNDWPQRWYEDGTP